MSDSSFDGALSPHPHGVIIEVWAVPGASRTQVVGMHASAVRIRVNALPDGGLANAAIAKVLGGALAVRVELLSGATARKKRFLARDIAPSDVAALLERATNL
ncbi:MAG: DUF167 domain-containing protein [Acidimicrobiia bacterium]|nr:DUF167 domain-containing protein [Acidimicrobiia bacterium]